MTRKEVEQSMAKGEFWDDAEYTEAALNAEEADHAKTKQQLALAVEVLTAIRSSPDASGYDRQAAASALAKIDAIGKGEVDAS